MMVLQEVCNPSIRENENGIQICRFSDSSAEIKILDVVNIPLEPQGEVYIHRLSVHNGYYKCPETYI